MTSAKTEAGCSPVPLDPPVGHSFRLFFDTDAATELAVQDILRRRRRHNTSGQGGEDISNIRAAISVRAKMSPNV